MEPQAATPAMVDEGGLAILTNSLLQSSEFMKHVSIDATKLNEYLFKTEMRMTAMEQDVQRMLTERAAKVKADKDDMAKRIDCFGEGEDDVQSPEDTDIATKQRRFLESFDEGGAVDEKLESIRNMLSDVTNTMAKMQMDTKQRTRLQSAKDAAQDEILEMELKRLERQIDSKLAKAELLDLNKLQDQKLKSLEAVLLGVIDSRAQQIDLKVAEQLDKVLSQLNNIQQASDASSKIMEERIKLAVGQGIAQRNNDAKRDKKQYEDTLAEVARLTERLVKLEEQQVAAIENSPPPPPVDVGRLTQDIMQQVQQHMHANDESSGHKLSEEMAVLRGDLQALEQRMQEDAEEKENNRVQELEELRSELVHKTESLSDEFEALKRDKSIQDEQILHLIDQAVKAHDKEEEARKAEAAVGAQSRQWAEAIDQLNGQLNECSKGMLTRLEVLDDEVQALKKELDPDDGYTDDSSSTSTTLNARGRLKEDLMRCLKEEVGSQLDDRRKELDKLVEFKMMEFEGNMQASFNKTVQLVKTTAQEINQKIDDVEAVASERRGQAQRALADLNHGVKGVCAKLVKPDVALSLGDDPPFAELLPIMDMQRSESEYQMARLERSTIGLAELYRQLQGIVQGLANKDDHWDLLEARLYEQCQGMVTQCLQLEAKASQSKDRAALITISPEMKDYIATNSWRIGKAIATKADYEVIRRIIGGRDLNINNSTNASLEEQDWDQTLMELRSKYLSKFVTDIKMGAHGKYPTTEGSVMEARKKFCHKVEVAIKLAMSKLNHIQVGRTLFGRFKLETQPTCVACNRPFHDYSGPGDKRAVCIEHLPLGSKVDKPSTAQSRTRDPAVPEEAPSVASGVSYRSLVSQSGRTNKNPKPVYRGGFKFTKPSPNTPLLYLDSNNAYSNSSPSLPLSEDGASNSFHLQGTTGSAVGYSAGLVKVNEDMELEHPPMSVSAAGTITSTSTNQANKRRPQQQAPPVLGGDMSSSLAPDDAKLPII